KGEKFVWNEEREKSFEELKQRLVSAPVLTLPSVADALSKKSCMIAGIKVEEEIIRDLERLDIELYVRGQHGYWASLRVEPDLISQIKKLRRRTARFGLLSRTSTSSGLLQPLDISVWKWDEISMDFVTGLPQTQRRHDAI
nr:hypothetical protein [Tanacetum cinerariifolium]